MMTFTEFRGIWQAAQEAPDRDSFLAGHPQPEASVIYDMAKGGIRAIRKYTQLSIVKFAYAYEIPRRTMEDWNSDKHAPPPYLPALLAFAVISGRSDNIG